MPTVNQLIKQFNQNPAPDLDLNTWDGIGKIVTDSRTGSTVRDAFRGGQAEILTLPAGTILYKFNNGPFLQSADDERQNKPISPWWTHYGPFRHDPGWLAKKKMAQTIGISVREWGRVTSAVKENWNSLLWLCVITLQSRATAAFGGFAHMPRSDVGQKSKVNHELEKQAGPVKLEAKGRTPHLPGGGTQFYIPNLKAVNVTVRYESLANS